MRITFKNGLLLVIGLLFDVRWIDYGDGIFSDITWTNLKWWILISLVSFVVFIILVIITNKLVYLIGRRRGWKIPRKMSRPDLISYRLVYSAAMVHYLISIGILMDAESLFLMWLHLLIWLSAEAVQFRSCGFPAKHVGQHSES